MKTILVTGAAGFIGYHLICRYLDDNYRVVGVDSLNEYYSVDLKKARLARLLEHPNFTFHRLDIGNKEALEAVFRANEFTYVAHMAAQAGVRYSLENPRAYVDSNLIGFFNILEACRTFKPLHLLYASSSSVYGLNEKSPFSEADGVDHPVSLYAATKRSNELMAHSYSCLFDLPVTGLRFFTVYGPWGRPDMALFSFTEAILKDRPIQVFGNGAMHRDFTYISDIIEGISGLTTRTPERTNAWAPRPDMSTAPFALYNVGNGKPVPLLRFIEILEECLGKAAIKEFVPMQPGDIPGTYADISHLQARTGYQPKVSIEEGVARFVEWYGDFYCR